MNVLTARTSGGLESAIQTSWKLRAIAVEAAVAANVVVLVVARIVNGGFPVATTGGDDLAIGFLPVIFVSLLAGLAAWDLLALLEYWTPRAKAIWTAVAIVIVVLSLAGPFGSGVNTSSKPVQASALLGAAAAGIPMMRRSAAIHT